MLDMPYTSLERYDVFDFIQPEYQQPDIGLNRPVVAEMLSHLVPKLVKSQYPWCAYLATMSGLCEIEEGLLYPPEDWIAMEKFVLSYEVPEEVKKQPEIEVIECGRLSTVPRGEKAIVLGEHQFYRHGEMKPVNDQVLDWYFEALISQSVNVPPMRVDYDNPFEMGRALKRRRIDQALELIGAIDSKAQLYIPGDGVGIFSYAARKLKRMYYSSEVGGVGQIAVDLGLIRAREAYTPLIYEQANYVMVASNLVPFCPSVLKWPGPMVIYDVQSFWHDHPQHLKLVQGTGYRVYATDDANLKLTPMVLTPRKRWSEQSMSKWIRQMESLGCAAFMTDDRKSLIALLEAHLPVVSRVFADAGYKAMIPAPKPEINYLVVGQGAGNYDIFTNTDHNTVTTVTARTFLYGRSGIIIYGSYGDIDRSKGEPFSKKMFFKTDRSYQKIYGKTRSFHHFRLRPLVNPRTGNQVTGVRTKVKPSTNIVVLAGRQVVSAVVVETWNMDGYFESEVSQGPEVATVLNRDVNRHESELEYLAKTGMLKKLPGGRRRYVWAADEVKGD